MNKFLAANPPRTPLSRQSFILSNDSSTCPTRSSHTPILTSVLVLGHAVDQLLQLRGDVLPSALTATPQRAHLLGLDTDI